MDTFFKEIEDFFNSGDQEIRTWFLVRQNYLPFILCGFYAFFTLKLGPVLMKNRKPFELRTVMVVFNFFLVAAYIFLLLTTCWYLKEITREQFCKDIALGEGYATYALKRNAWGVYILKYIEFFDTVLFILRKRDKQVTLLHVSHHTCLPFLIWIILRTERNGLQSVPAIINSIVHVIMYSYYGLAAMGPRVRKHLWWKKYLTLLQMLQFVLVILFVIVVAPLTGCTMVNLNYLVETVFVSLMLYLFYRFYKSSYEPTRKSIEINGNPGKHLFEIGAIENEIYTIGNKGSHVSTNSTSKKQE